MQLVEIKKIGKPDVAYNKNSDYGDSGPHIGIFTKNPMQGESFLLYAASFDYQKRGITTSVVTKIIDDNTFETMNSIYHWEFLEK